MSGAEIASRFEAANAEAIDYVLGPASRHWDKPTDSEGWPVGVTARHIALGHELVAGWVECIRTGSPITSVGDIHERNAEEAARGVVATPEHVATMLRERGSTLADALRTLTDEQLSRDVDFGGQTMKASMVADAAVRHVQAHLGSIRSTVGE